MAGFAIGKFAIATVATGIALSTIIKYKQKTTTDRINKELEQKNIQLEDFYLNIINGTTDLKSLHQNQQTEQK